MKFGLYIFHISEWFKGHQTLKSGTLETVSPQIVYKFVHKIQNCIIYDPKELKYHIHNKIVLIEDFFLDDSVY